MSYLGILAEVEEGDIGLITPKEFLITLGIASPDLVFWIVVVILAAVILRRGGGGAERFLIVGAGLKIMYNLLRIPSTFIIPWLFDRGYSMDSSASIVSGYEILLNIISMAGIICLLYAFWVKFKLRNINTEGEIPLSQN